MLIRAAKGELTRAELKVTRVEARLNSYPIAKINEEVVTVGLAKVIGDTFEYFNSPANETIIEMLVDDILEKYGMYSALEIVKAITEGRRAQGSLFGKLSGHHFLGWINDYLGKQGEELAEYRRNEGKERQKEVDSWGFLDAAIEKAAKKKRERSGKEKADAERYRLENMDPEREAHGRAWTPEKGVSYEGWMRDYDKKKGQ